jgi:hypothetical protein
MPDLFVKRHAGRGEDPFSPAALVISDMAAMKVRLAAACVAVQASRARGNQSRSVRRGR